MATATVTPIRVTPSMAATMLSLHHDTVYELIATGIFTVIAPNGRGSAKRIFLFTDEVTRYAETGDPLAVRTLRADKGRLKK